MYKQQSFDKSEAFKDHKKRTEHGGDINKGKRKLYRPFETNKAIHATLRSSKAKGSYSFMRPKNQKEIERRLYLYADRFGVRIFKFANSGNHLHILLKSKSKKGFQNFLRTFAGVIPRVVTGARKGKARGKFWDTLVYSKLVTFGKHFKNTSNYVVKNTLETFGVVPPRGTGNGLKLDYQEILDGL